MSREGREAVRLRNGRLLLDAELHAGEIAVDADLLGGRVLRRAVRPMRVPPRPWRIVQQLQYKLERTDYARGVLALQMTAREAALGGASQSSSDDPRRAPRHPPRVLVRVDEFPHAQAWDEPTRYGTAGFRRFHEIMERAGVPYLVAVPPRVSRTPLDPLQTRSRALDESERTMLGELRQAEGVSFALHGRDHRTRYLSPRRRSELCGLSPRATEELLDRALAELAEVGIEPEIFVPPFNRFDARQYAQLARRFRIVCGGPESIGLLGFQLAPTWHEGAVYLPSYRPLYARAAMVRPALEGLLPRAHGLWLPIALHWGWEADDGWEELEALARLIAPYAASWEELLAAARRSSPSRRAEGELPVEGWQ